MRVVVAVPSNTLKLIVLEPATCAARERVSVQAGLVPVTTRLAFVSTPCALLVADAWEAQLVKVVRYLKW